eukprot:scaffold1500_cov398-Prasinococcus_capsulatus_cf.AAC.20
MHGPGERRQDGQDRPLEVGGRVSTPMDFALRCAVQEESDFRYVKHTPRPQLHMRCMLARKSSTQIVCVMDGPANQVVGENYGWKVGESVVDFFSQNVPAEHGKAADYGWKLISYREYGSVDLWAEVKLKLSDRVTAKTSTSWAITAREKMQEETPATPPMSAALPYCCQNSDSESRLNDCRRNDYLGASALFSTQHSSSSSLCDFARTSSNWDMRRTMSSTSSTLSMALSGPSASEGVFENWVSIMQSYYSPNDRDTVSVVERGNFRQFAVTPARSQVDSIQDASEEQDPAWEEHVRTSIDVVERKLEDVQYFCYEIEAVKFDWKWGEELNLFNDPDDLLLFLESLAWQ